MYERLCVKREEKQLRENVCECFVNGKRERARRGCVYMLYNSRMKMNKGKNVCIVKR